MSTNFSNAGVISRKFWQDFFDLFRIRKKQIHWGTVYDSKTKQPIDPAVVELYDYLTGELKQTAITDIWGKYGFLAERGDYLLRVKRSHYIFPSAFIKGSRDGIYDGLYHGEQISIREKSDLVSVNIPLDPVDVDYNQQAKQEFAMIHPWRENLLQWLFNLIFLLLVSLSGYLFYLNQGLWQTILLIMFISVWAFRFLLPPKPLWGQILSVETGEPMGYIDLELLMPQGTSIVIAKTRSVPGGKYFLKARAGDFILRLTDPFTKQVLAEGQVKLGNEGLLTADILI